MYRVTYSCNFGCYEFIENEELDRFATEEDAVEYFINLSQNINSLDLSSEDSDILYSWGIGPEDTEYGEFYGGFIRFYDDDRCLLYAEYDRDLESKTSTCGEIELGEEATEDEIESFIAMGIIKKGETS